MLVHWHAHVVLSYHVLGGLRANLPHRRFGPLQGGSFGGGRAPGPAAEGQRRARGAGRDRGLVLRLRRNAKFSIHLNPKP